MIEQLDEYRKPLMESILHECLIEFPTNAQASIAAVLIARDVFSIPPDEVRQFYRLSSDIVARAGGLAQSYEALSGGEFFESVARVSRLEIDSTRNRMRHALEISLREQIRNPRPERDIFTQAPPTVDDDPEVEAFDRALQGTRQAPVPELPTPGRHLRL